LTIVWKPEGKGLLGKSRYRWEYDIKIDVDGIDYLADGGRFRALALMAMNLAVCMIIE
jgi:hypothetical protein